MTDTYADMLESHRTARRASLIASAAEAIEIHGLRSVTIDAMADHAGVAKMVLYRYFGSKNALIDAVLTDMVDSLLEVDALPAPSWKQRLPRTLELARNKRAALRVLLRQAPYDPRFGRHLDHLHAALAERTIKRVRDMLGDPGLTPGNPEMLARISSTFMLDAYLGWIDSGDPRRETEFLNWLVASVQSMTRQWWNVPAKKGRD